MTSAVHVIKETVFGPSSHDRPHVSVLMITYNHEEFIDEAIKSVFMQQVDFLIELVIGEDCSTDHTLEIIKRVCQAAPIPVRLLTSATNVGMHQNFRRTLRACTGQYVALLEGDDAWIVSSKLKLQAQALDFSPDMSFCYHQAVTVGDISSVAARGQLKRYNTAWPSEVEAVTCLVDVRKRILIPTAAVMFRRSFFFDVPLWFDQLPWADWPLYLSLLSKGNAKFLPIIASKYNIHPGGVSDCIDGASYHYGAALTFLRTSDGLVRRERVNFLMAALDYWSRYVGDRGLFCWKSLFLYCSILFRGCFSRRITKNAVGRLINAIKS